MKRLPSLMVCLAPLWLMVAPARAQVIQGIVIDADAGQHVAGPESRIPIAGAEVVLIGGSESSTPRALTDSLGRFSLPVPGAGTYRLRVRHPAYKPYDAERFEIGIEETMTVEVRLGRDVIPLEPLVVTARLRPDATGFDNRRAGGGFGSFLTREDIEARAAGRTTDLLRGMPGLTVKFERWGVGNTLEMRGGFGTCEPAIFVDGVLAPQVQGSKLDDFLSPDRIEAVEVYSSFSTAPVQYITGTCGVVLFWTRRGGREDGHPWNWKRVVLGLGAAIGLVLFIK